MESSGCSPERNLRPFHHCKILMTENQEALAKKYETLAKELLSAKCRLDVATAKGSAKRESLAKKFDKKMRKFKEGLDIRKEEGDGLRYRFFWGKRYPREYEKRYPVLETIAFDLERTFWGVIYGPTIHTYPDHKKTSNDLEVARSQICMEKSLVSQITFKQKPPQIEYGWRQHDSSWRSCGPDPYYDFYFNTRCSGCSAPVVIECYSPRQFGPMWTKEDIELFKANAKCYDSITGDGGSPDCIRAEYECECGCGRID